MSHSPEANSVLYWNCLAKSDNSQKLAYIEALQAEADPQAIVMTEFPTSAEAGIRNLYNFVSYKAVVNDNGIDQGMCVASQEPLDVTRHADLWQPLSYQKRLGFNRYEDAREIVSFDLTNSALGTIAINGGHITHNHHWWRPGIAMRRPHEWRAHNRILEEYAAEDKEWLWFADTNTIFRATVQRLLVRHLDGGMVQPDGPTWSLWHPRSPRIGYIDRAATSAGLLGHTSLKTMPRVIEGVRSPSDHSAILLTVDGRMNASRDLHRSTTSVRM